MSNHQEILPLERDLWTAVNCKDGDRIAALLAEEYVEITLDGKRVSKGEIVSQSPVVDEIDDALINSESVVPLGDTTALLSYHLTLEGTCGGIKISPRDRWATSVWSNTNGAWRCQFFQQSHFRPDDAHISKSDLPPGGWDIQPMAPSDFEEALTLWHDMDGVGFTDVDTPDGLANYLRRNPGMSFVVRRGDQMIGAVLCGHDGRRGYLHHLAVIPQERRRGIGSRLVEQCLAKLESQGVPRCNIYVYANNNAGQEFWQRQGWNRLGEFQIMQRVIFAPG